MLTEISLTRCGIKAWISYYTNRKIWHGDVIKEAFSVLLALCAGNSSVASEFPSQRPVPRSFDVFVEGNPPDTGGFPSQRASNAENISIWWRHHVIGIKACLNLVRWHLHRPLDPCRAMHLKPGIHVHVYIIFQFRCGIYSICHIMSYFCSSDGTHTVLLCHCNSYLKIRYSRRWIQRKLRCLDPITPWWSHQIETSSLYLPSVKGIHG